MISSVAAIRRGMELAEEGADVLDIGGESTRPGADPVAEDEEARRVAHGLGYPVLVRPSYVLGGRAMQIVTDDASLEEFVAAFKQDTN